MKVAFGEFKDTSIFERFMLNTYQFSAAKSVATAKLMQNEVFNSDRTVRSFGKFKKEADAIATTSHDTWLRVEYESARRSAVMGEQFRGMMRDKDLYPYWVYRGVMDSRERPEHVELEGQVFRIGDNDSDMCYPPLDWNCRCHGEPIDDDYLDENKLSVSSREEATRFLDDNVDDQFRFNKATDGPLPSSGSYFEALANANAADYILFGQPSAEEEDDDDLEGLAAKGLHYIMETVNEWHKKEHVNQAGDIVFQNKALFSNILFTNSSLHVIGKHARGFENIPSTISHPDEVWAQWEDPTKQRDVLRNYIKLARTCYIVQTRSGIVTDAFAVSPRSANKYRKGVLS